jgi:hypothetical protein
MDSEAGQSTVELIASLPALLLAGLIAFQLFVAGYALTLADGAAEAGALALASGSSAKVAVRDALPGWAEDDIAFSVSGGSVTVRLRPPSPIPALADHLAVTSSAFARPAEKVPGLAHLGVLGRSRAEHATLPASLICLSRCLLG